MLGLRSLIRALPGLRCLEGYATSSKSSWDGAVDVNKARKKRVTMKWIHLSFQLLANTFTQGDLCGALYTFVPLFFACTSSSFVRTRMFSTREQFYRAATGSICLGVASSLLGPVYSFGTLYTSCSSLDLIPNKIQILRSITIIHRMPRVLSGYVLSDVAGSSVPVYSYIVNSPMSYAPSLCYVIVVSADLLQRLLGSVLPNGQGGSSISHPYC